MPYQLATEEKHLMAFISFYKPYSHYVLSTLDLLFGSIEMFEYIFPVLLILNLFVFLLIVFVPLTTALEHSSRALCPETARHLIGPFGVHVQRHVGHQICRLVFESGLEALRKLLLD